MVAVSVILFIILRNQRTTSMRAAMEIRKHSLVAEKTGNGVIITDCNGKIEWVNEAFTKISGYSPGEVVGRFPWEVLHGKETDPGTAADLRRHAAAGLPISRQIVNYRKDGTCHWTHVSLSPVLSGGKLEYTIAVHTDISQLKLNKQKIELQNKQLKEIAFQTSHLVRAPLANILGLAALIKANGCTNEKNEELLGLLEASANQLDHVIKDIALQTTQARSSGG